MQVTHFAVAQIFALASGILASCGDNPVDPVDPLADEELFDRAVMGVRADAQDRRVEIHWSMGFLESKQLHRSVRTYYRLLFSDSGLEDLRPIEETTLRDKYAGSRLIDELENGKPYYFAVQIVNLPAGRSLADTVMAIPHVENPSEFVFEPQSLERMSAAWSPDGTSIAYVGMVDSTASDTGQEYSWPVLFVYDLTSDRLTRYVSHGFGPSWSPDSKRIALNIDVNRTSIIAVLDLPTRILSSVTDGRTEDHSPAWSTDGRQIAYLSYVGGSNQIRRYDLQGSVSVLVASGETPWFYPSDVYSTLGWSPDGDRIVFARRRIEREDSKRDIYTIDVNGNDLEVLVESRWDDSHPAFSPDGNRLAFLSRRSGRTNIWTVHLETGRLAQLTSEDVDDDAISWSSDGTQIVFTGYREHLRTLRKVRVPAHR